MRGNVFSTAYLISNAIAVLIFLITVLRPVLGRMCMSIIFIAASIVNAVISISHPEVYRLYGDLAALPAYEHFIEHTFSRHITTIVLLIAIGQLLIGIGLFWKGPFEKTALGGAIVFLLAIAPLGAGSSFPCSVFLAIACIWLLAEKKTAPWLLTLIKKCRYPGHLKP